MKKANDFTTTHKTYRMGDSVCKKGGAYWHGRVVGCYSTNLTPEGYAVESHTEAGSVQIYPVGALIPWDGERDVPFNRR